jgi:arabinofuranan 3-O-arabinosyltransferase
VLLERGEHAIVVDSTDEFVVDSVVLTPVTDSGVAAVTGAAEVTSWAPASRSLVISAQAEPRVLELNENANPGWVATLNDEPLTALRVDGWRQAWWIPAGVGGAVSVEFAPNTMFWVGLIAGAIAVVALVALCAIPVRRRCVSVVMPVRPWEGWLLAGVGLVAAGLLAGFAGVVVSAATMAIVWLYRLRRSRMGLIVAALGAATILASMWAWPQRASAPAWVAVTLTLLTVLGLAAAAAPWRCRADESTAAPDAPVQTTTQ